MEKNHPLSELMAATIQQVRTMADANTIIGYTYNNLLLLLLYFAVNTL